LSGEAPAPTAAGVLSATEKKSGMERFNISSLLLDLGTMNAKPISNGVHMMHIQHTVNWYRTSAADDFVLHCVQTRGWRRFVTF
jgi:hypothetical protein